MTWDWRKDLNLCKRLYFWYMKLGLISIPFGLAYGLLVAFRLHHESVPVLLVCMFAAIVANYKIQGMPPEC